MTVQLAEQPAQIQPQKLKAETVQEKTDSAEESFGSRFEEKIKKLQENGKNEKSESAEKKSGLKEDPEKMKSDESLKKKGTLLHFFPQKKSSQIKEASTEKSEKETDKILIAETAFNQSKPGEIKTKINFNPEKPEISLKTPIKEKPDSDKEKISRLLTGDISKEEVSEKTILNPHSENSEIKIPFGTKKAGKKKDESGLDMLKKADSKDVPDNKSRKNELRTLVVDDKRSAVKSQEKPEALNNGGKSFGEMINKEEKVQGSEAKLSLANESEKAAPEVKEMTVFLGENNVSAEGDGGKVQAPVTRLLSQQLKNQTNQEIAKNINFVLKDNNQGEIKLILKPEALGQVKIHLDMNENNIVGRIVVENNNVRQAFTENLNALAEALKEQGFENAALDVSVGNRDGEGQQQPGEQKKPFFSERLTQWDDVVPAIGEQSIYGVTGHIDLVV